MGELGSKPEELYAKHKESAEAHERAQRRMDVADELKDIVKKNATQL